MNVKENIDEKIQALSLALSTVHTVHRLLTSTLNFDELLPRVARLCLQVLRSNDCSILLLDDAKKYLIPRVHVHLARPHRRKDSRNLPVGAGIEGKVAKTGNAYFKKNLLCVPLLDEDVLGVITIRGKQEGKPYSLYDREILMTLAEQAVIAFKNAALYEEQEKLTMDSIRFLAAILESKTPGRKRSSDLLVTLALGIAAELHLSHEETKMLHYAILLHDAGILSVPEHILTKPSKLTGPEYRLIQKVPTTSAKIVRPLRILEPVLPVILHHTERYDGNGYPKGLKGEEIPLGARILAVIKAFEAMVHHRPYRRRVGLRHALMELKRHQGGQFDPQVVEAFLRFTHKRSFRKIVKAL
ncbi:MAG: HD domain-containing protein [Candidatus Omnitrophica bacterium]|nr:HD domain-containing protein [Candidatus Omnitrophota bacterium]